jgi:hypothetical protein
MTIQRRFAPISGRFEPEQVAGFAGIYTQGSYELLSSVLADPVDHRCPPFSVTLC